MAKSPVNRGLPLNVDDLLHLRVIEDTRIEFKAAWNEKIKESVLRTICAFANDILNLNGGYVILGVEEVEGRPVLPLRGLDGNVDRIQRDILGTCKKMLQPEHLPQAFVETVQGKTIVILWIPGGDNRPYQFDGKYWVRSGPLTVEATGDLHRQLIEQTAKIPFDDRRSLYGTADDISPGLVRRFLDEVRSGFDLTDPDWREVYRKLRLTVRINGHEIPRNVALLFFNHEPENFFPGIRGWIEVAQFADDAGGDFMDERVFKGPLPEQLRACLKHVEGVTGVLIQKVPDRPEAIHLRPYPQGAVEEALVNAVYHRSYEEPPEPIKVYLYPDRMAITSYPGPIAGIRLEHFKTGRVPMVPARNRRIGEFLKDLHLAEARGTGVEKIRRQMRENGSPEPVFDFDEATRTYFSVTLPIHPRVREMRALHSTG